MTDPAPPAAAPASERRLPISACVITLDEEAHIEACLASASFCDDLVVVDSHSQDRTRELAAGRGARVFERDWPGHIEQKNFAIEQARHDWVLCLDADERVSDGMRAAIAAAFAQGDPPASGFRVRRLNRYLGRWIRHGGWYPDPKLRLFRRSRGRWGGVNPHDRVEVEGPVEALAVDLLHEPYQDLADHLRTMNSFTTVAAREKLKRRQGLLVARLLFAPPLKFAKMYLLQRGCLDGWPGFISACMGSFYVFLKYAKLWELLRASDPERARRESSYQGAGR